MCSTEDIEHLITVASSSVQNCTLAVYNFVDFDGREIETFCYAHGAKGSKVITVSSVVRSTGIYKHGMGIFGSLDQHLLLSVKPPNQVEMNWWYSEECIVSLLIGDVFLATSKNIVVAWWGPTRIPDGHILKEEIEVNSVVCHPDEEDTLVSTLECTGWIKMLLMSQHPQVVYDVYSVSGECNGECHKYIVMLVNFTGELTQLCMTSGIKCFAIQPSAELASSLASNLGFDMRGSDVRGASMEGGGVPCVEGDNVPGVNVLGVGDNLLGDRSGVGGSMRSNVLTVEGRNVLGVVPEGGNVLGVGDNVPGIGSGVGGSMRSNVLAVEGRNMLGVVPEGGNVLGGNVLGVGDYVPGVGSSVGGSMRSSVPTVEGGNVVPEGGNVLGVVPEGGNVLGVGDNVHGVGGGVGGSMRSSVPTVEEGNVLGLVPEGGNMLGVEGGNVPAGGNVLGMEGGNVPEGRNVLGVEGGNVPAGGNVLGMEGGNVPAGGNVLGMEGGNVPEGGNVLGMEGGNVPEVRNVLGIVPSFGSKGNVESGECAAIDTQELLGEMSAVEKIAIEHTANKKSVNRVTKRSKNKRGRNLK